MRISVFPYQQHYSSLLLEDVANTLLVNHAKSVCVCQFVHTFSHPLQQTGIRALGFSNFGGNDVRFARKNWQLCSGFWGNAPVSDGICDV